MTGNRTAATTPETLARARTFSTTRLKDCRDSCRRLMASDEPESVDRWAAHLGIVEFALWERRKHQQIMALTEIKPLEDR